MIAPVDAEEVGCDLEEDRVVFLVADVGWVDDMVDGKRCADSPAEGGSTSVFLVGGEHDTTSGVSGSLREFDGVGDRRIVGVEPAGQHRFDVGGASDLRERFREAVFDAS